MQVTQLRQGEVTGARAGLCVCLWGPMSLEAGQGWNRIEHGSSGLWLMADGHSPLDRGLPSEAVCFWPVWEGREYDWRRHLGTTCHLQLGPERVTAQGGQWWRCRGKGRQESKLLLSASLHLPAAPRPRAENKAERSWHESGNMPRPQVHFLAPSWPSHTQHVPSVSRLTTDTVGFLELPAQSCRARPSTSLFGKLPPAHRAVFISLW